MGELGIFLGRLLQAENDAMVPAAVAVTVLLGKLRHPLAARTDPQPDGHATVGLLRHQRGHATRHLVPVRTPTPADLFVASGLVQEFAGPIPKRFAPRTSPWRRSSHGEGITCPNA
jgi:hypothetical protein